MSQQNKTTLQTAINTQIADNTTGEISAADVRDNLINITDSLLFNNGDTQTIDVSLIANYGITGSLQGTATYAESSDFAVSALGANSANTANFVTIIEGPGITVNGMEVTADVRTVNGIEADGFGNIPLSLGTVLTGTSASLVVSSSGAVTASIADATVWIISGDGTPANNGDTYIFKSGSVGQWLTIAPLDQAAGDARYARKNLAAVQPLTSSFASLAVTASYVTGSNVGGFVANATNAINAVNANQAQEAIYADGAGEADQIYSEDTGIFDNDDYVLLFTDNFDDEYCNVFKQNRLTYNPSENILSATSSYALTASYVAGGGSFPYTGNAVITGSLTVVNGNISAPNGALVNTTLNINSTNAYLEFPLALVNDSPSGDYGYLYRAQQYANLTYNPLLSQLSLNNSSLVQGQSNTVGNYTNGHAEGQGTVVNTNANFSHAEGNYSQTIGYYSHAEGSSTRAHGGSSHAEGDQTATSGSYSHAEGYKTIASGSWSHAEGNQTKTTGSYSHAEGTLSRAIGDWSHAEGASTQASGSYSHAEGSGTAATGTGAHAEGSSTLASGTTSHAEGQSTTAAGTGAHAEGSSTQAIGDYSHAEGLGTVASGSYQHAQGQYNISSSAQSAFIIGNGTSSSTRSNLLFASGSRVQITGSLNISGSIAAGQATVVLPGLVAVEYVNDAAAAAAGIPVGGLYRNGSFIQIRIA